MNFLAGIGHAPRLSKTFKVDPPNFGGVVNLWVSGLPKAELNGLSTGRPEILSAIKNSPLVPGWDKPRLISQVESGQFMCLARIGQGGQDTTYLLTVAAPDGRWQIAEKVPVSILR